MSRWVLERYMYGHATWQQLGAETYPEATARAELARRQRRDPQVLRRVRPVGAPAPVPAVYRAVWSVLGGYVLRP